GIRYSSVTGVQTCALPISFLDAVLHLAAGAIELLVEMARLMLLAAERGDDKARVGRALGPFGLGDDPALAAPAVPRRPHEILERSEERRVGQESRDTGRVG